MKCLDRADKKIDMPCNLILTKDGVSYMVNSGVKLKATKNHMGINHDGIESSGYNAETLQKLVMNSYLEELFVSAPELLNKRYEIISTNNLIIFAILYRKLSPSVWDVFSKSSVVKDFNRKNPKNSIVSLDQFSNSAFKNLMQTKKRDFDSIKQELLIEVMKRIQSNTEFSDEDRNSQLQCLDKFVAWIDDRIWYIFYVIYRTELKDAMLSDFGEIVADYLKKTPIATHLSNLLMELVQNAEKSHMERIIIRNNLAKAGEIANFIRKSLHRERICDIARHNNDNIILAWTINQENSVVGHRYRIHISVIYHSIIDEIEQDHVNQKMHTNVDGISIAEFYSGSAEDGNEQLDQGLGMLYHSYLEDHCRKEKINYNCNIIPDTRNEKITVSLDITL